MSRPQRYLAGVLMAASLVPIWSVTYFPAQNGPWYLLVAKMLRDFRDPALGYAEYYCISWHAIPYLLHVLLVTAASFFVDILTAHKFAVSIYALLLPTSVFYFLSVVAPQKIDFGFLSFLLIFNYPLFRGYQNFALAIPFFLFAFAYWVRWKAQLNVCRWLVLNLLVLLVYLSHVMVFAFLSIGMAVWALRETRRLRSVLVVFLQGFVPSSLLFADFVWLNHTSSHWVEAGGVEYLPLNWTAEYFFIELFYPISTFRVPVGFLLTVLPFVVAFLLFVGAIVARVRLYRDGQPAPPVADGLAMLTLVYLAMYFVMPYKMAGWHHANTRLAPFVVLMAMGFAATLSTARWQRWIVGISALASLGVFALLTVEIRSLDSEVAEYVSGVPKIEMNKTLLAIHGENSVRKFGAIRPTTRAHDYYQVFRGGANGQGVAHFNTIVPVWYRHYPVSDRFPDCDSKHPETSLPAIAATYDYVLIWDADKQLQAFVPRLCQHHFRLLHRQERLQIYENRARLAVGRQTAEENRAQ